FEREAAAATTRARADRPRLEDVHARPALRAHERGGEPREAGADDRDLDVLGQRRARDGGIDAPRRLAPGLRGFRCEPFHGARLTFPSMERHDLFWKLAAELRAK